MRRLFTISIVLFLCVKVYGADVEFVGDPIRWNPVDISTIYTQKITVSGKGVSLIVHCGAGMIGTTTSNLSEPYNLPYGEEVFTKVCGKALEPESLKEEQGKEVKQTKSSISAEALSAIKKRVIKANKSLSSRISKGYIPNLPISPEEDTAYMQLALNTKSIVPDKDFIGECYYKEEGNNITPFITCNMFFPGKYATGQLPEIKIKYIEMVSTNFANSTKRGAPTSINLNSFVNIQGKYEPVFNTFYDKKTDTLKSNRY